MSRSFYNSSYNSSNNQQEREKSFHITIILKIKKFISDIVCVFWGKKICIYLIFFILFSLFQFTDHMD